MSNELPINRRVLIVDDNQSIHDDFRRILSPTHHESNTDAEIDALETSIFGTSSKPSGERVNFDVASALQGREALDLVQQAINRQQPYALAFVDMRMPPGWDGMETVERLWAADPALQVVICSAYSDYRWQDVVMRLGRSDQLLFLRKPFDPAEVHQLALSLTQKWTLQQLHAQQLLAANDSLHRELAERRRIEDQLRYEALHDALTDLPNRALLMDRIGQCIERMRRHAQSPDGSAASDAGFAVIFLDLDNLKLVNDSLGHRAGDALLMEVARRLSVEIRSYDSIGRDPCGIAGRLGGDEFIVLLENIGSADAAHKVAQRLQDALRDAIAIEGREVFVTASIGIAMGSANHTPDALLREADTAMYRAKLSGKAQCAVFDQHMHAAVLERLMIEADLRMAIDRGEMTVAYQPIVNLETGELAGFESLLRWNHPKRGPVSPAVFIPIAEDSGLIDRLGLWTLEHVAQQLSMWKRQYPSRSHVYVSVNIARRQLLHPDFASNVAEILRHHAVMPSNLHIEVTENAVMHGEGRVIEALSRLRVMGCCILMDDFGTGHSSLSCLHRYPIDVLKIDRAFVDTMNSNRDYAAVVHAIVMLAHNLNVRVVAEGVETQQQVAQLQALNCDYAQGYLFSRPVPGEQATAILAAGGCSARAAA